MIKLNKKGAWTDLFVLVGIVFALILMSAFFLLVMHNLHEKMAEKAPMIQKHLTYTNASLLVEQLFGEAEESYKNMDWIIMIIFGAEVISFFILNALVKTNKAWFFAYVFVVALAVVFSIYMSNTFERIAANPLLATQLNYLTAPSWLLLNMPMFVSIIGFIGAVLLIINMEWGQPYQ